MFQIFFVALFSLLVFNIVVVIACFNIFHKFFTGSRSGLQREVSAVPVASSSSAMPPRKVPGKESGLRAADVALKSVHFPALLLLSEKRK